MSIFPDAGQWLPDFDLPEMPDSTIGMRFNALVDFVADPCEAPWEVYIETALPFLGRAFLILMTPDVQGIIENFVEPKGYGSCFRNRRNERGKRNSLVNPATGKPFRLALPDVDELIAAMLPGRSALEGRKIGSGEAMAWKIFNVTEFIAYKIFIFDLVTSTAYAWHTALLDTEYCEASALQVARLENADWTFGPIGRFETVPQNGKAYSRNGGLADLSGISMFRRDWGCRAWWKITNTGTTQATGQFRIWPNQNMRSQTYGFSLAPGETVEQYFRARAEGPAFVAMQINVEQGQVRVTDTMLWGQQNKASDLIR